MDARAEAVSTCYSTVRAGAVPLQASHRVLGGETVSNSPPTRRQTQGCVQDLVHKTSTRATGQVRGGKQRPVHPRAFYVLKPTCGAAWPHCKRLARIVATAPKVIGLLG